MAIPRRFALVALSLITCSLLFTVHAGLRGRGKYSGVVIFDRWDTCFLLSGPYITYISQAVKERLRPYAGQAVQIDATDIMQPFNPGDALVKAYELLGPAPDDPRDPITGRVQVFAEPAFSGKGTPAFDVIVRNRSTRPFAVSPSEIGPTLLGVNPGGPFNASDGRSMAWMTRVDLEPRGSMKTAAASWASTVVGTTLYARYSVEPQCPLNGSVELAASDSRRCRIHFEVPAGEYQFIVGFGGGVHEWKSLASNAISFNVDQRGVATVEP